MAQAGGAQREPSMEEILASIRRIIQDSDPAQQPAAAEPEPAAAELETPALPEARRLREVEAFRAELDEPPVSATVALEPEAIAAPAAHAEIVSLRIAESDETESAPAFEAAAEADLAAHLSGDEYAATAADDMPEGSAAGQKPAIISDSAGRQVAAAFGELSEAFAASRRRSFDDMAQEMLRPMLQEWLDNNLPTLVERLVREEIERVARGG